MKRTWKRFLSLVLCMCMVLALLPNVTMTAFAATSGTVTDLADENIGLSFTGDADDAWSANGMSIIGAATSTGGCNGKDYKSTLTITNKKSTTATLSFDYSIEQNSGKIHFWRSKKLKKKIFQWLEYFVLICQERFQMLWVQQLSDYVPYLMKQLRMQKKIFQEIYVH